MKNSQLQLKNLSEKNAKALASTVTKFLSEQSIVLQHTKALDLAGVLCGFADWQGLQAAIVKKHEQEASSTTPMSYDDFLTTFKPKLNHLSENANCDGYAFEISGEQFQEVVEMADKNPRQVWTCVEAEGTSYIIEGLHMVNRLFYLITINSAKKGRTYEVIYGHDEGDLKFEISVVNPATEASEVIDIVYGPSAQDVLERLDLDYEEEIQGVVDEGENRIYLVTQVV